MQLLLNWTGDFDLQKSVAEEMEEIGFVAHKHVRSLLRMDDDALRDKFKGLKSAAMDELTDLVNATKAKAADGRDPVVCFIEEVLRKGVKNGVENQEKHRTSMEHLESHLESLKVVGARKIGFTIKLDSNMPPDGHEGLCTSLEEALKELLPGGEVLSLQRGCILVTCEWLSGGAWELPPKVRQTLSDPTFELAGFPLLFEDGAPSLKIEYFKVQLRASDVCLQLLG